MIPGGGPGSESQPRSDGIIRSTQRGDGGKSALDSRPVAQVGEGEAAPQVCKLAPSPRTRVQPIEASPGQQNQFRRATEAYSASIKTRRGCCGFQSLLAPLLTRGVSHFSSRAGRARRVRDCLRGHAEHAPTLSASAPEATWRVINARRRRATPPRAARGARAAGGKHTDPSKRRVCV